MSNSKKVIIIGSGFAGLSAACFMAKAGWQVEVLEKHNAPGGRARQLKAEGFTFDMGPSWYWMPDIFERFFNQFSKSTADYYSLKRLDPSYRIYWEDDSMDIPAGLENLYLLFEKLEPGSSKKLESFLEEAAYKYKVGMQKLVHKPGQSVTEFLDIDLIKGLFRLDVFNSIKKHIGKNFRNKKIQQLLEFPVLFLGALPEKTPALYSLMNYADIKGGTWYPEGGMYRIVDAMYSLAISLGVEFHFNQNVSEIQVEKGIATTVKTSGNQPSGNPEDDVQKLTYSQFAADVIISGADYHHTETVLLSEKYRSYSENYWDSRVLAPSCLIYYIGINKKIKNIHHHTLFFDTSFDIHGKEIYDSKEWPTNPLFYVSATSVSDPTAAPAGCENLFFLIPVASGLTGDTEALRDKYFDLIITRFEKRICESLKQNIIFKKTYAHTDFVSDYNAFKGNAYGLANTLMQTAILKPSCRSKKVKNLFYTGQLTVPGPGVPPSLISGEIVAKQILNNFG